MSIITPCINPNPDIAGIGVRVSVYVQASLNLVCALVFARNGRISGYETSVLTRTSVNLFVTGCALLVAAFIQAGASRFSVYHALIVLNLSWITTLSAVLYLIIGVASVFFESFTGVGCSGVEDEDEFEVASSYTVLYPSIAHISGMGAFGILVWSKINTFGDQSECTPLTFLTVFFHDIPVTHRSLRRTSLALYSIAAFPFANIFVVVFLGMAVTGLLHLLYSCLRAALTWGTFEARNRFLLVLGVTIAALLEILFIVDTELMISRSTSFVKEGDSLWSFGQTLAMVMLIIPLTDTGKAAYKSWKAPVRKMWRD